MASNTENLNLLMKNPSTDGADTFNVQTMLNENWQKIDDNAGAVAQTLANILKPTTPPLIGLPPSTTPDGMFQALWNTGELHVWRKTVNVDAVVPTTNTGTMDLSTSSSAIRYSKTAAISNSTCVISGDIKTLNLPATAQDVSALFGMFAVFSASATSPVYYIVSVSGTTAKYATTQVGKAPSTTYPVSTNPNAYQEGSDAKEAGYTLGEPKTTVIPIHPGNTIDPFYYGDANNIAVTDDGVVSVSSGTYVSLSPYNTNNTDSVKGKYIQGYPTGYPVTSVYYIPADATFSNANGELVCDKAQLVTGYAAIPAGTTIEYLGKLGDKARVQVLSYVGTGTYGSDNPVSITFDFVPKSIWVIGRGYSYDSEVHLMHGDTSKDSGKVYYFAFSRISWENKTVSWCNTSQSGSQASALQANSLGETYKVLAIS